MSFNQLTCHHNSIAIIWYCHSTRPAWMVKYYLKAFICLFAKTTPLGSSCLLLPGSRLCASSSASNLMFWIDGFWRWMNLWRYTEALPMILQSPVSVLLLTRFSHLSGIMPNVFSTTRLALEVLLKMLAVNSSLVTWRPVYTLSIHLVLKGVRSGHQTNFENHIIVYPH